ncbi:hypothetical protein PS15m_007248 [Mucor circinelloides]
MIQILPSFTLLPLWKITCIVLVESSLQVNILSCLIHIVLFIYSPFYTEWINGVPGPFKLELLKGNNAASMQNTGVSFKNAEGSTGSYKWQVPSDIPAGTYAFHYVFNGGESYSPQFKITSGSAASSNQAQQHTESAPVRGTSDSASNGSNLRSNTGASTSTPPNTTSSTRAQSPPQSASGATSGSSSGSSSALSGTVNRVPQQQVSQQRQPIQNENKAIN